MAVCEDYPIFTGTNAALLRLLIPPDYDQKVSEWMETEDCRQPCLEALSYCATTVPNIKKASRLLKFAFEDWKDSQTVPCVCGKEELCSKSCICRDCGKYFCMECWQTKGVMDSDDGYTCMLCDKMNSPPRTISIKEK